MAFDAAFLDELRARTPLASLIGRRVKLTRSGHNWRGCCPFHGEKTPSFYVYDDHFHCFGCGAHGDAISFVMQSDGRSFPEAVEGLAAEAGLEVPRPAAAEARARDRSRDLIALLELAREFYAKLLWGNGGREALSYLRRRGIHDDMIETFGLGWSGEGRGELASFVQKHGIPPELLSESGLMRLDEHGCSKGELFFSRVMFPITNRKGQVISFGGRTLGQGQPKYLNGLETAVFSKRRQVFAQDRAQAFIRRARMEKNAKARLIVVEGYMDVISLHQAGFEGAVAPLGTALTSEQMEALWRISDSPVMCFDGDTAGRKAAIRVAETALPLLTTERDVHFCILPDGEDPDSLIQKHGGGGVERLLSQSRSLAEMLFTFFSEGYDLSGPQQRAALKKRLVEASSLIKDRGLAAEYRALWLDQFYTRFRKSSSGPYRKHAATGKGVAPQPRSLPLDGDAITAERMRILTVIILHHPQILADVEDAYGRLPLRDNLARLRSIILDGVAHRLSAGQPCDRDAVEQILRRAGAWEMAENVLRSGQLPLSLASLDVLPLEQVAQQWWHFYGLLNIAALQQEIQAAAADFAREFSPKTQSALIARRRALEAILHGADMDGNAGI